MNSLISNSWLGIIWWFAPTYLEASPQKCAFKESGLCPMTDYKEINVSSERVPPPPPPSYFILRYERVKKKKPQTKVCCLHSIPPPHPFTYWDIIPPIQQWPDGASLDLRHVGEAHVSDALQRQVWYNICQRGKGCVQLPSLWRWNNTMQHAKMDHNLHSWSSNRWPCAVLVLLITFSFNFT